ncbi:AraC family transcriptional regulator [Aquimarina sp. RZ0]|uniref:AraC family transcriptional regulator n=1 Tax=Aquimarina sp. RZ0 TaxID=2607730 RepID=UPI0011F289FF|nr:AraC family transcriptional regulator [Aquimarina sp. RZ0]KAA1242372.1 AraC family transcriptional regulator [Aquimarina sp. RZ0]
MGRKSYHIVINRFICFIILVLAQHHIVYSQQKITQIDSLTNLEFQLLLDKFNESIESNPEAAKPFAEAILQKAKKNEEPGRIASSYRLVARVYENSLYKKIAYLDSAIFYGEKSSFKSYPTIIYVDKGVMYADNGLFNEALDNYINGLKYAKKKNDDFNEAIINHNIALLKRKLGKYDEAKSLFKLSLNYESSKIWESKNDTIGYLSTLAELVTTYRRNKEIDSALTFNSIGIKMSKNLEISGLFKLNKGIINYYQKDYKNAIININKALKSFSKPENKYFAENYNVIDAYLFLGKSYTAISNKELAITNYKKIDSLIQGTKYSIPEVRQAYTAIIEHYKSLGDKSNQLHYINRLLYNDSIIDRRFRSLNTKLIKDFDTPILISEKEKLIKDLTNERDQSNYGIMILLFILLIITVFLILNYRKRKLYKIRFEELMQSTTEKTVQKKIDDDTIGIAADVVANIVAGLDEFESNKGFTQTNMSSAILATQLHTNTKYLTKVIKHYRQKSFSPYINDLRITYIIEQLKTDKKLQNYTIKALATEAGFNSAEVFSKYFYKTTGIYPSYFIKQVQLKDN